MDYVYFLAKGNLNIKTPGVSSFQDIHSEVILKSPEKCVTKSVYPNGFSIVLEQAADSILVTCNQPLIDNGDGSFTAPTDK